MSPHDRVVEEILEAVLDRNGEVRLLGRMNDPILGNPSSREVFLFIPDLHLLSADRQDRFGKYGFNHAEPRVLGRILERMARLRLEWAASGEHKLVTVQLGDFFDLWREFPRGFSADSIRHEEQGDLRDLLYRGIHWGKECVKASVLLGNHDTKSGQPLREIPFLFKAFNRPENRFPFLFATHGDCYDVLERLVPEAVKAAAVDFIGDLTPLSTYTVAEWGKAAAKTNKRFGELEEAVMSPLHELNTSTGSPTVQPKVPLPDEPLAAVIDAPDQSDHHLFEKFYEAVGEAAERHQTAGNLRAVVIGHTHHARMVLCQPPDGRPMLMMDVGGWIEQCQYRRDDGQVVREPSAQLGVIHENDARIYQISLPDVAVFI